MGEREAAKREGLLTPGVLCPFDFVNELSIAMDVNEKMGVSINSFAQHVSRLSAFGEKPTKQKPREFCVQREWNRESGQPSPRPLLGIHSRRACNAITCGRRRSHRREGQIWSQSLSSLGDPQLLDFQRGGRLRRRWEMPRFS